MEITETTEIGPRETEMIKKHLSLVLSKSPLTVPKAAKIGDITVPESVEHLIKGSGATIC